MAFRLGKIVLTLSALQRLDPRGRLAWALIGIGGTLATTTYAIAQNRSKGAANA